MAKNRKNDFSGAAGSARGEDTGIIKPAVERPALSGGQSTVKSQPARVAPKVVAQDGTNVFDDNTVIDEKDLARSRKEYVRSGGTLSDKPNVSRVITAPTDRDAGSKESLKKLNEHYRVMSTFADTHSGAVRTASRTFPLAFKTHANATKKLSDVSTNLALAKDAFAQKNSAKGNGHLKSAIRSLISAHKDLNNKNVREITGTPVSIHPDELKAWSQHISKLPSFRRQGKPFEEFNFAGQRFRTGSRSARELSEGIPEGTEGKDKITRAEKGTPRTPKWERGLPGRPSRTEKMSAAGSGAKVRPNRGGEAIDTTSRGTSSGTTGEMDPRRKGSKTTRIETTLRKPNLPKIGDTTKKVKPAMKPGDTVEGK
jgi:hypothetical protein